MSSDIANETALKTSTLMLLCMCAGIGLSHIEVSGWISTFLNLLSLLFERFTDIMFAFFEVDKPGG